MSRQLVPFYNTTVSFDTKLHQCELSYSQLESRITAMYNQHTHHNPGPHYPNFMRIYSEGVPYGEITWAGRCVLCKAAYVSNLDPKKMFTLPDACGANATIRECFGAVVLVANHEALLAAWLIGGYEALARE